MNIVQVRPLVPADQTWVARLLADRWGSPDIVSRGLIHRADQLPGFVAVIDDQPAGLATYRIDGSSCELVSLDSLLEGLGTGTKLIEAVAEAARTARCNRLWLVTTNDNQPAVRFYQGRGFRISAVHAGAIEQSRKLKPSIPEIGVDGIPIRDEIEMDMRLKEDSPDGGR